MINPSISVFLYGTFFIICEIPLKLTFASMWISLIGGFLGLCFAIILHIKLFKKNPLRLFDHYPKKEIYRFGYSLYLSIISGMYFSYNFSVALHFLQEKFDAAICIIYVFSISISSLSYIILIILEWLNKFELKNDTEVTKFEIFSSSFINILIAENLGAIIGFYSISVITFFRYIKEHIENNDGEKLLLSLYSIIILTATGILLFLLYTYKEVFLFKKLK